MMIFSQHLKKLDWGHISIQFFWLKVPEDVGGDADIAADSVGFMEVKRCWNIGKRYSSFGTGIGVFVGAIPEIVQVCRRWC